MAYFGSKIKEGTDIKHWRYAMGVYLARMSEY